MSSRGRRPPVGGSGGRPVAEDGRAGPGGAGDRMMAAAPPPAGSSVTPVAPPPATPEPAVGAGADGPVGSMPIGIPLPGDHVVRLVLVDIADPGAPRILETLDLDGRYLSARLVDGTVRLVTTSTPRVAGRSPAEPSGPGQERAALEQNRRAEGQATVGQILPTAVHRGPDGAELSNAPAVDCSAVQHAQGGAPGVGTLLVTTLRPAAGLTAVRSTAVTTDGDLVYASTDRLYVATSRWGTVGPVQPGTRRAIAAAPDDVTTEVHAFDTSSPTSTRYLGSGSVHGYLYGRWALSEHEGHLRVATTLQPPWDGGGQTSSSMVVLAEDGGRLVERGRLDGLGQDERIHAVRYFGDLAVVVTFRQTDPLYVLDLSDPARPRRLGELKIPGFSSYLHPVGDDRLLAVGQDADASGRITGFQLSLFDLTDRAHPRQVDRLALGQGHSPASEDSRAFGYHPQRRLGTLPFTSWQPGTDRSRSFALGVRVTPDFHLVEAGRLDVGPSTTVERVLIDGDIGYAVTPQGVVAMDPASLARRGSAVFAGVAPAPRDIPLPEPSPGKIGPGGGEDLNCAVSSDRSVFCPDSGSGSEGAGNRGSTPPGAAGDIEPESPGAG